MVAPRFLRPYHRFIAIPLLALLPLLVPSSSAWAQSWTVASRTDYPVGSGPEWSTVADLNNDGFGDIVTANFYGNSVTVLLNNGTGNYLPGVHYPSGSGPFTVAAFDLNHDGFQDLVVANYLAGTISVLMGNGTGTFNSRVDHASGANTAVAAIGWFNGDVNADIVTANFGANTVSVFLGNGSGGFTSKVDYAVGTNPNWVAVADIDRNGTLDLVTANYGAATMTTLVGNGGGGFGGRQDIAVGAGPLTLSLADFDGDNIADVVTANYWANTMSVLKGNGTGGFGSRVDLATGAGPVTVHAQDLNVDGFIDLAVCNSDAASVSIRRGKGDGTFFAPETFNVGATPYAVAIGDVTNDGVPDLVACNFGDNDISVLKGSMPGGFRVGEQMSDLIANDQNGQIQSLAARGGGNWLVVDVCSRWCGPCQFVARDAQRVYNTWIQDATIPFEYAMLLVDGLHGNVGSTQADAAAWATRYSFTGPVLHSDGKTIHAVRSWFEALGTNAYPTIMIVDPSGVIREIVLGALEGQELINRVAAHAGVAAPTLVPPLPPPPPPPPPAPPRRAWQAIQSATIDIQYGASTWSGSIGAPQEQNSAQSSFQIGPTGVPGIPNTAWIAVTAETDSTTDVETLRLFVGTANVFEAIQLTEPWQVTLRDINWPDGAPRALTASNNPNVWAIYPEVGSGADSYFQTGYVPASALNGTTLSFASFTLANVPNIPATTNAFEIGPILIRHTTQVADVPIAINAIAALAPPRPNPARAGTTLEWAMARNGRARLEVVDVAGRLVKRLHDGDTRAGQHVTPWDFRTDGGGRVAAGIYFVRLAVDGEAERTSRLVVLE